MARNGQLKQNYTIDQLGALLREDLLEDNKGETGKKIGFWKVKKQ